MKNILVTGANGLVGSHFAKNYGHTFNLLCPPYTELDITDSNAVSAFFKKYTVETVVHFAAYTDVSNAEKERANMSGICWRINVEGTKHLVTAAKDAHFIYISTDMIFSGKKEDKGPYEENHLPEKNPDDVPWYGWTKKCGEDEIKNHRNYSIVRISNPVRKNYEEKADYIQKILSGFAQKGELTLFNDQFLTLTPIASVSDVLEKIILNKKTGIYHVSSTDVFTPYAIGSYIIQKKYGTAGNVHPTSLEKYVAETNQKSRYPQYGGLSVHYTEQRLNILFPTWKQIVDIMI